jgi:serine/threonine protein kinase
LTFVRFINIIKGSLGVIVYELVTGGTPYKANNIIELMNGIKNKKVEYPKFISKEMKTLLIGMLTVDLNNRFDFEDLLSNEYIQNLLSKKKNSFKKINQRKETNENKEMNENQELNENRIDESNVDIKLINSIEVSNKGEIMYPEKIFDFSKIKNKEDINFIEYIEENAKKAWVIAELAFIIDNSNESYSLYYKSIELLFETMKRCDGSEKCERLEAVYSWMKEKYNEFLSLSKEVRKKIKSNYKVCPEELLYIYAVKIVIIF